MTVQTLNILCLTDSGDLPVLVKSVYSAIPHQIVILKSYDEVYSEQQTDKFDLFIIDNYDNKSVIKEINKLRILNSSLCFIVIEDSYDNMDELVKIPDTFLVGRKEMISKLPLILGEVYSILKNRSVSSFGYFSLLKLGFDSIANFVAILDEKGKIIFINKEGMNKLVISDTDFSNLSPGNYVREGDILWKHIVDQCLNQNKIINDRRLDLINSQNEDFLINARIEPLKLDKNYILIQEIKSYISGAADKAEREFLLLDKFADSIANELLNPINVFSGRLQMLSSEFKDNDKVNKNLKIMEKQVKRINGLMGKLQTFSNLKNESIPQKFKYNELFTNIEITPSLKHWLQDNKFSLEVELCPEMPFIEGKITQFDLLIKLILEIGFDSLGSEGKIRITTDCSSSYIKNIYTIYYSRSIFTDDSNLTNILGKNESDESIKSIEATIIKHIIYHYKGKYNVNQLDQNTEELELFIPK